VEGADPTKVRGQLTEFGLVAEEYGGDTMFVDISAQQGDNLESLLAAVVLTADPSPDLRPNPAQAPQGTPTAPHPVRLPVTPQGRMPLGLGRMQGWAREGCAW
ncbi:hypothetical protein, partial [Streptomyces albidoflavus]|uniref:hypothetical protein n=1 Tax=Streptomyces albidoflavus TaxID=1886 RepID=UPI003FA1C3E3